MRYRTLGRTGMQVSRLCLGTMMFGPQGNPDHGESIAIIHRALDSGINFVDTADRYSQDESEQIVGKALKGRREDVVLATKFNRSMGDDPNRRGNSRRWIMRAVDDSLRRLDTDWIDLYQAHRWDPETELDETLGALNDLVSAGKIRNFGTSTFPVQKIVEGQWVAQRRGLQRFATEQPPYSLLVRGIEADVLPACRDYGLGVLSWGPLAAGWLSGLYRRDAPTPITPRAQRRPRSFDLALPANQRKLDAADALGRLADEARLSLIHLALAFVINHPALTSAIIGPRTMEQFESQLGAVDVTLDSTILDCIDEIVPPGTDVNAVDSYRPNPALAASARRRTPEPLHTRVEST